VSYVVWFDDYVADRDRSVLGGKNCSLGEMTGAGLPVPPGFGLTTAAYAELKEDKGARSEVNSLLREVDLDDAAGLRELAAKVRNRIEAIPMSAAAEQAIIEGYELLCDRSSDDAVPVAVRSSATAEDLPDASFAGLQDTFLWVTGAEDVVAHVHRCWSSVYTDRAIAYRHEMGHDHDLLLMSVGIQKMVRPTAAGVAFTLNPSDGDHSQIAIDSSWGFGESVVSGEVTPDNFLVDKVLFEIVKRTISAKGMEYRLSDNGDGVVAAELSADRGSAASLTDDQIKAVARMARRAERHYGSPQDIEWAIDADLPEPDNVVLLQSRPETVWSRKKRRTVAKPGQGFMDSIVSTLLNPAHSKAKQSTFDE
jgi:pyruvate,water dikinase